MQWLMIPIFVYTLGTVCSGARGAVGGSVGGRGGGPTHDGTCFGGAYIPIPILPIASSPPHWV